VFSPTGTEPGPSSSSTTGPGPGRAPGGEPAIVAVTRAGALVKLDPATGTVSETLASSGVSAGQVSVSSGGTVYFATGSGCVGTIKSVPASGGTPKTVWTGWNPAISPDGTKLAFADEPGTSQGGQPCPGWDTTTPGAFWKLGILDLATGAKREIPQLPESQTTLPAPIDHLSWSADNQHVAVSIASVQDNEGWGVNLVDTSFAQAYLTGPGVTRLPATGNPTPKLSYLREAVYLPGGNLFVSRACCQGWPPKNTSRLMWEVTPTGTMTQQVAIGFPAMDHLSLDASRDGSWLLYIGGSDLYVSQGGARPAKVASGLVAAAWG
jgi:hypothetical protein